MIRQDYMQPDNETLYYCPQSGGYVSSSAACPQGTTEPDGVLYATDQSGKFTTPSTGPSTGSGPTVPTGGLGGGSVPVPGAQPSALPWLIGGLILLMLFSKDK